MLWGVHFNVSPSKYETVSPAYIIQVSRKALRCPNQCFPFINSISLSAGFEMSTSVFPLIKLNMSLGCFEMSISVFHLHQFNKYLCMSWDVHFIYYIKPFSRHALRCSLQCFSWNINDFNLSLLVRYCSIVASVHYFAYKQLKSDSFYNIHPARYLRPAFSCPLHGSFPFIKQDGLWLRGAKAYCTSLSLDRLFDTLVVGTRSGA